MSFLYLALEDSSEIVAGSECNSTYVTLLACWIPVQGIYTLLYKSWHDLDPDG